jgi:hypothetical protein
MRPLTTDFMNLKIDVWRYAHYYEQNVLVVNLAILAIGFCSFALPATETSSRTDLTLNVLFGCVGIRFVVDESLPRLPYNTALQGTNVCVREHTLAVPWLPRRVAPVHFVLSTNFGAIDCCDGLNNIHGPTPFGFGLRTPSSLTDRLRSTVPHPPAQII